MWTKLLLWERRTFGGEAAGGLELSLLFPLLLLTFRLSSSSAERQENKITKMKDSLAGYNILSISNSSAIHIFVANSLFLRHSIFSSRIK